MTRIRVSTNNLGNPSLNFLNSWGLGESYLIGGWTNPFEKYERQTGFIFPKVRGENKKCLKPPPRIKPWDILGTNVRHPVTPKLRFDVIWTPKTYLKHLRRYDWISRGWEYLKKRNTEEWAVHPTVAVQVISGNHKLFSLLNPCSADMFVYKYKL